MKTIIGKTYFVPDGSYRTCLTNDNRNRRLLTSCPANDYKLIPVTILSEPFKLRIKERIDQSELDFVLIVDDREDVYSVIFKKDNIVTANKPVSEFERIADDNREFNRNFELHFNQL